MKKIILVAITILITALIFLPPRFNKRIHQLELLRLGERIGLVKNTINLLADNLSNRDSLKLYWIGYLKNEKVKDTVLIYNKKLISDIPDSYGENELLLEYLGGTFNKIGIWKRKEWYKYVYGIEVKEHANRLMINWMISNNYEKEQGTGTMYK